MVDKKRFVGIVLLSVFITISLFTSRGRAENKKILVVMSYHESFFWSRDIRRGIEESLGGRFTISWAYLDTWRTKNSKETGEANAAKAFELLQEIKPDLVIATDDNAQSMFVVPYLDRIKPVPVVFCGVNNDPKTYGYPNDSVTGALEVIHFRESISFLQQLVPSVKTVGFLMRDRPTNVGYIRQYENEHGTYSARTAGFKLVGNMREALEAVDSLKNTCDALFLDNLEGLPDDDGNPLLEKQIMPVLTERFGKPTMCSTSDNVKLGVLCAVVVLGEEQGELAGEMAKKVLSGTPVSRLPMTRNKKGKAILNMTVMRKLGIKPAPSALSGVEIVRSE